MRKCNCDKSFVIVPKTDTEKQIYFIRQRYWDGMSKTFYLSKSKKDISSLDIPSFGPNGSLIGMRKIGGWDNVLAVRQGDYVYNMGRLNHIYKSEKTKGVLSPLMKGVMNAESSLERLVQMFETDGYDLYTLICLDGKVTVYRTGYCLCNDKYEYLRPVIFGLDLGLAEGDKAFFRIVDENSHFVGALCFPEEELA